MQFKFLALAAAFTGVVVAQGGDDSFTPDTVVESIQLVTDISADTTEIITSLNPVTIFTAIPRAINNIRQIVTAVGSDVNMITNVDLEDPFPEDGQEKICETFRDFVRVHQKLLEAIIGRNSLLSRTPFTAPIAAVLRLVESGVDALAFGIIDLVPTCAEGAKEDKEKLDASFEEVFTVLG